MSFFLSTLKGWDAMLPRAGVIPPPATETPATANNPGTGADIAIGDRSIADNQNQSGDMPIEPVVQLGSHKPVDRPEGVKRAIKKKHFKPSGSESLQDRLESIADFSILMSKAY